jgi:decaprenylphospho-beta-D-erythro-pentofuranosid-2-ulose 2-reductase
MANSTVVVFGCTSLLGKALVREYAAQGRSVIIVGRDPEELSAIKADTQIRFQVVVHDLVLDLFEESSIDDVVRQIIDLATSEVSDIFFVAGYIPDSWEQVVRSADALKRIFAINFSSIALAVSAFIQRDIVSANYVFISSVAGDRGRKSNYPYGAAKAALNTFSQGLRSELLSTGGGVFTIKLGYMDTRMAFGKAPATLSCSPAYAAKAIHNAIRKRRSVVYVPGFWRLIMLPLKLLPEAIFIRLPLP